jgi:hypothetical protein
LENEGSHLVTTIRRAGSLTFHLPCPFMRREPNCH